MEQRIDPAAATGAMRGSRPGNRHQGCTRGEGSADHPAAANCGEAHLAVLSSVVKRHVVGGEALAESCELPHEVCRLPEESWNSSVTPPAQLNAS